MLRVGLSRLANAPPKALVATKYFDQFPHYCHMVESAKQCARRSVLIDHCGHEHIDIKTELDNIEKVYTIEKETRRGINRLSLVEFQTESDAKTVVDSARHNDGLLPIPLKILLYDSRVKTGAEPEMCAPVEQIQLSEREDLSTCEDYTSLLSTNVMSLVEMKLRFITLVNLERLICAGIFEEYELMPFGSSVIDIGRNAGDLDIIMTRKIDHHKAMLNTFTSSNKIANQSTSDRTSNLVHLDKSIFRDARDSSGYRGVLKWCENILRDYMPLVDGLSIQPIYHAKVPIIKFNIRITNIECDLSFDLGLGHRNNESNPSQTGIPMSQVLYCLCRNSNIFTGLVVYLRLFAQLTSITSKEPNIGMTNFQFLSMIIFYLQQISITSQSETPSSTDNAEPHPRDLRISLARTGQQTPVIPSFRQMIHSGFRPPFQMLQLSDQELNHILPDVILGFFDYYSKFNFDRHAMNIYESRVESKLDNSMIYVVNPIDIQKNICHNVNRKGCDHFVKQARKALTSIRQSKNRCPLTFLKDLMARHQRESSKTRKVLVDSIVNEGTRRVSSVRIAHDVCKDV